MGILSNIKLRTKLFAFIGFMAVMLVVAGGTGLYGITASKQALLSVYNDHLQGINLLGEVRNRQMQIRGQLLTSRLETDAFEIVDGMDRVRSHIFHIEKNITEYKEKVRSPEQQKLLDEFIAARNEYGMSGVMPSVGALSAMNFKEADNIRKNTLETAYEKASRGIDAMIAYQSEQAKSEYERVSLLTNSVYVLSIAAVLAGVALAIVVGLLLARGANVRLADRNGWTALHWAAQQGQQDIAAMLVRSAVLMCSAGST